MTFYAENQDSIPGRVTFLIEGFPSTVRQMSGNLGHFIPGYHLAIDHLNQRSSTRGPPAALGRVLFGPGRVFHKIQCVMNIEA